MKNERPPRSFWPTAIIGYFVIAIIGIVIFIAWAVHQDMDLVREDYYAEEVRFQQQLDRIDRSRQLQVEPEIRFDEKQQFIVLKLPGGNNEKTGGRVHLYRPSDAALDQKIKLCLTAEGTQQLDARDLPTGLWKVRLQWSVNGEEFFAEKSIVISRGPRSNS